LTKETLELLVMKEGRKERKRKKERERERERGFVDNFYVQKTQRVMRKSEKNMTFLISNQQQKCLVRSSFVTTSIIICDTKM